MSSLSVFKVGGSLFDLPDLGQRLAWLAEAQLSTVLLVPGGGPTAEIIRNLDRRHRLGEEAAHWLACARSRSTVISSPSCCLRKAHSRARRRCRR